MTVTIGGVGCNSIGPDDRDKAKGSNRILASEVMAREKDREGGVDGDDKTRGDCVDEESKMREVAASDDGECGITDRFVVIEFSQIVNETMKVTQKKMSCDDAENPD